MMIQCVLVIHHGKAGADILLNVRESSDPYRGQSHNVHTVGDLEEFLPN